MRTNVKMSIILLVLSLVATAIQLPVNASTFTASSVADDFDWTGASWYVNAGLSEANLNKVVWAGGRFVAVGDEGTILISDDGVKWSRPVSHTLWNLNGIAYNGNAYVVVGDQGTVLVSTDAVTWSNFQVDPGDFKLNDLAWGLGKFVAVGEAIIESLDGVHWNVIETNYSAPYDAVTANGSTFVAVGGASRLVVISKSNDGITWDGVVGEEWNTDRLHDVVWDGSNFRAVGGGYDQPMYRISADGTTWTDLAGWVDSGVTVDGSAPWDWNVPGEGSMFAFSRIEWTGQQYLAIGGPLSWVDGPKRISLLTSPDGLSWSSLFWHDRSFLTKSQWEQLNLSEESLNWINDLAWSDTRLVIVSQQGQILTSAAVNDGSARLSDIKVDGKSITGFDAIVLGYKIGISRGTTSAPVVTAQAADVNSIVTVIPATQIPGITTVEVTNGSAKLTYHLRFAVTSDLNLEWQKSLGGTGKDEPYSIRQTSDGGYIMAGDTSSKNGDVSGLHPGTYAYYTDAWVVKVNPQGELEWQRCLGGSGEDTARSVIQTGDGDFIVAGYTDSSDGDFYANLGVYDAWIAKLDSEGNEVWLTSLGSSGRDQFVMLEPTSDGGFVAAGNTKNTEYSGTISGWLVKFSAQGDIEWQQNLSELTGWVNTVRQTADGGYILGGDSPTSFAKLDVAGNLEWKRWVGGNVQEVGLTVDGGYIVSTNGGIIKLDAQGNTEWQKIFELNSEVVGISHASQTSDGGYIVAGTFRADFWVAKLDSTGAVEGMKRYGGTGSEGANEVWETGDGGYIVAGKTGSSDGDVTGNHGGYDFWLVKIQPDAGILSTLNDIVAFIVPNQVGTSERDPVSHTVMVGVPFGTDLSALVPSITVSSGASISPAAGTAGDFTNPVTYFVTAENGDIQSWTVSVNFLIPGDTNNDGMVDVYDLVIVARSFGKQSDSQDWDARADLNNDGWVDATDLAVSAQNYSW